MKLNGHYWCDHCDENAFGANCQKCARPARFVPNESKPAKRKPQFVSPERGRELFARLRQSLL
jgi:hypothetical protein